MMRALALSLLPALLVTGCVTSVEPAEVEGAPIAAGDAVYVAKPRVTGTVNVLGSRRYTQEVLAEQLGTRFERVETGIAQEDAEAAVASARAAGASLAVVAEIEKYWVRDHTYMTSLADEVEIRVSAYDVPSGELRDTATLRCKEDLFFGSGEADALLAETTAEYVQRFAAR